MRSNIKIYQSKGRFLLKLSALTIILAYMMPVMMKAQEGKTNFSGNWVLNASKSSWGTAPAGGAGGFGGRNSGTSRDLVVTQDANLLTVSTTTIGQDGNPVVREVKYTLDFKPSVNFAPGRDGQPGNPATSYAKWSEDGKTLRIVTKTIGNGESKTTEEWTLINTNTLSRTSVLRSATGTETRTSFVYDRKRSWNN
jgi:hypothetical protein